MDEPERGSHLSSVGWGLFLASSWTWCIGAFLPLLLLRDWGWKGFVVFALPNVIGATAVGFLWTRERSRAFMERRRVLLAWFSTATLAYQAFFIAWIAPSLVPAENSPWSAWLIAVAAFTIIVGGARGGRAVDRVWMSLGVVVTLGSYALWSRQGLPAWSELTSGEKPTIDLWLLAPAIALGFLVCPHLDLSFHRVLQNTRSRVPWIIFAPAFAAMLFLAASGTRGITGAFAAWWFIQVSFTAAVHARELRASPMRHAWVLVPAAILVGAVAGRPGFADAAVYLRFLGLYGAVFPAIALLLWRGWSGAAILAFLAMAIPAFELGFLGPGGIDSTRWAWAPLVPIVLLLGMLVFAPTMKETTAPAMPKSS